MIELIQEFKESDYESALLTIKEDVPAEQTKKFQVFVNKLLKQEVCLIMSIFQS